MKETLKKLKNKYLPFNNKGKVMQATLDYRKEIDENINIYKELVQVTIESSIKMQNEKEKSIKSLIKFDELAINIKEDFENVIIDKEKLVNLDFESKNNTHYKSELINIESIVKKYLNSDNINIVKLEKINHQLQLQIQDLEIIKEQLIPKCEFISKTNKSFETNLYKLNKVIGQEDIKFKNKVKKIFFSVLKKEIQLKKKNLEELDIEIIEKTIFDAKSLVEFVTKSY